MSDASNTDESDRRKSGRIKVRTGGARPPCLDKTTGQCRGCYGWDQMVEAARADGPWKNALIRCDCTGLTVRIGGDEEEVKP